MSYEHCDKHDLPATNGCKECAREHYERARVALRAAALEYSMQVEKPAATLDEVVSDIYALEAAAREFVRVEEDARGSGVAC